MKTIVHLNESYKPLLWFKISGLVITMHHGNAILLWEQNVVWNPKKVFLL